MGKRVPLSWASSDHLAIVIDNLFSKDECDDLIARVENHPSGFMKALVNMGGGNQINISDIRNNDRCIIDDRMTAALIWQRIESACSLVDEEMSKSLRLEKLRKLSWVKRETHAVGLNERLRFLRYDQGTYFTSHQDGSYVRSNELGRERRGERSYITCQLYLNEGFEGGST